MLSHNIASKQANKDEDESKGGGGGGGSVGLKTSSLRPPEQTLKCPRCDSPNTKFCYFNNYSLAQPRHFCKACRRYWTKGGALRTVPVGGSCRKNKKTKSCSSRFFLGETSSKGSSSDLDFQLGGLNFPPRVNQLPSSYGFVNLDPLGFNFPFSSSSSSSSSSQQQHHHENGFHEMGATTTNHVHHNTNDLASSIESLSFINQDLHWKLQQQRLAMLNGATDHQQPNKKQVVTESHAQKLQPILFQNLDVSKPAAQSSMDGDSRKDIGLATEYASANQNNSATPTDSNSAGNDQNGGMNNWSGIQGWNHMNQYSQIP